MNLLLLQIAGATDPAGVLALCFAMTIALLVYIFYIPTEIVESSDKTRASFLRERKDAVYENLRDLNFEHKAGKIAEHDYQEMREALEEEAAALIAEIERLESAAEAGRSASLGRGPLPKLATAGPRTKGNRK